MGACDVKLTIHKNRDKFHTNLDTLRGTVELKVNSEITVENVQVKFEGFSRTRIEVKERSMSDSNNSQTRTVTKSETHPLVYKVVTLFPPPNVREVSNSKKFTLTPGKYEYDFEIKVPLESECTDANASGYNYIRHSIGPLPPSATFPEIFSVDYILKVTVRRTSWYKTNIREFKYPKFTPFDPIDEVIARTTPMFARKDVNFRNMIPKRIALTEKPTGPESYRILEKKTLSSKSSKFLKTVFGNGGGKSGKDNYTEGIDVPFALEVRVNSPYTTIDKPLNMTLFITSQIPPDKYKGIDGKSSGLGEFYLQNLKIELLASYYVVAENYNKLIGFPFPIIKMPKELNLRIDLANLKPSKPNIGASSPYQWEMEIDYKLYGPANVSGNQLVPSFKTCNIEVNYKLNVMANFVEDPDSWSSSGKKIEVNAPIIVLSGIPPPEEYIQMKQIPPHIAQQLLREYPSELGGMDLQEDIFNEENNVSVPKSQRRPSGSVMDGNQLPTYESATQL